MSDILLFVTFIVIFIVGPFWLISKMDKNARTKGALFTGQPTRWMKALAIGLGIVFAGLFVMELLSSDALHIVFPILAVALIGYGLGAGQLLSKLQRGHESTDTLHDKTKRPKSAIDSIEQQDQVRSASQNRLLRFAIKLAIILLISALVIYGALWTAAHPDNPLSLLFVVGVIGVIVLTRVLGLFRLFNDEHTNATKKNYKESSRASR